MTNAKLAVLSFKHQKLLKGSTNNFNLTRNQKDGSGRDRKPRRGGWRGGEHWEGTNKINRKGRECDRNSNLTKEEKGYKGWEARALFPRAAKSIDRKGE